MYMYIFIMIIMKFFGPKTVPRAPGPKIENFEKIQTQFTKISKMDIHPLAQITVYKVITPIKWPNINKWSPE